MDDLAERMWELAEGLAAAHFGGPPVDPFALAESLGMQILRRGTVARWTVGQASSRSLTGKDARPTVTIYLPRDMPPERLRFTLAHEIVEAAVAQAPLPMVREQAGRAEALVQLGASALLMPRRWFKTAGVESGWNLDHLRTLFEVSWEAAARRVPVCTPAICTIVDNGRVSTRLGSEGLRFPRRPAAEERAALTAVYDAWPSPEPHRCETPTFRCTAWPALPERHAIRRVCLLTFPRD